MHTQISVQDTGIGIPQDKHEVIFQKFSQADSSTTRKYGGTGLGLAITKQLIELMHGTIHVESEVNIGSTFIAHIPFETTDEIHEERNFERRLTIAENRKPVKSVRILIAEDHPFNQAFMQKLMGRFGILNYHMVSNGLEACHEIEEHPYYDLILMDGHMPEMNGYDATKKLKADDRFKHVPIIAMTADAMVGDREKCLKIGMDDYVSKPININEFKAVLSQWIDFGEEENTGEKPQKQKPLHPKSEIVIEREPVIDLSIIREFTDGDLAQEKEMIQIFKQQSDQCLEKLSENIIDGLSKQWSESAHLFKGGAGQIGASKLRSLCERAQNCENVGKDLRQNIYDDIKQAYTEVVDELKAQNLID